MSEPTEFDEWWDRIDISDCAYTPRQAACIAFYSGHIKGIVVGSRHGCADKDKRITELEKEVAEWKEHSAIEGCTITNQSIKLADLRGKLAAAKLSLLDECGKKIQAREERCELEAELMVIRNLIAQEGGNIRTKLEWYKLDLALEELQEKALAQEQGK